MRPVAKVPATAALIACLGATGLLLSACGGAGTLGMPGEPPEAFGQLVVAPDDATTLSFGVTTLCVSEGSARVTAVRFTSGNLPISTYGVWSLHSSRPTVGYLPGELATHGFPSVPDPVTAPCLTGAEAEAEASSGSITDRLAIDIATTDQIREGKGLAVTYETDDGQQGELQVPFELKVCPPTQPAPCQEQDQDR